MPLTFSDHLLLPQRVGDLCEAIELKKFQEDKAERDMSKHNERDARIRRKVKELGDYFQKAETVLRHKGEIKKESRGWNSLFYHAFITHQDDMTKVDLPHFVVNASSDINRWRFDVNAHVNPVTNEAVIFSHDQGTGAKNASMIFEEILLQHLISCRVEDIKVVISDNASVGKNWVTTIALPQYFVDQGLAKIVLVIFLENNHGKFLADMLFGQFQSRRRRSVLLGIDDLLSDFERVRRKSGRVQGFAVNPLSTIDFDEVQRSLGYLTSPPSAFGFVKRNIHFSCACAAGAKKDLPPKLRDIIGTALPDDVGMVRISIEPPMTQSRNDDPYGYQYFDVPAAQLAAKKRVRSTAEDQTSPVPLVVPLEQEYREKGNCVVSNRTAKNVDYNGIAFRKTNACPELTDTSKPLVRRAWPRGLLDSLGFGEWSNERATLDESKKCAPENWIVRRPVSSFCESDADWIARYPPRNLLNAKYSRGPRESNDWIPTATYEEPPFPFTTGTCAKAAMKNLSARHTDLSESLHVLHLLRVVFEDMNDGRDVKDPWLQRTATVPRREAIEKYKAEMKKYALREEGHPGPAKTIKQFFKEDPNNAEKVAAVVRERGLTGAHAKRLETKLFADMFAEVEATPVGIDRYQRLMEQDVERYSRELKAFKELQKQRNQDLLSEQ